MKKHYFPHDYSASTDQKILQLRFKFGAEGYGVYWMILETMAQDSTGYLQSEIIGGLSLGYGVAITPLLAIIDFCVEIGLFEKCEHGNYYSKRLLMHKQEMSKFSEFGSKGAEIRWKNKEGNSPPINPPNSNKSIVKESKEIKEKKTALFEEFWSYYPKKQSKDKALEKWYKLSLNDIELIRVALVWQKKQDDWTKENGKYVPMASTYLNQKRWLDEPIKQIPQPSQESESRYGKPLNA